MQDRIYCVYLIIVIIYKAIKKVIRKVLKFKKLRFKVFLKEARRYHLLKKYAEIYGSKCFIYFILFICLQWD